MKSTFTSKSDLAQAYFPYIDIHSACHKLMWLIQADPDLMARLQSTGYQRLSRSFSPVQTEMIMQKFGNPFK